MEQLLNINLFKDVLIPMVAAYAAIWLALKKFKKERLWQEKYAAYQEVLASIEALSFWAEQAVAEGSMLPTLQGAAVTSLQDDYSNAKRRLVKHATIGRLLLSPKMIEFLERVNEELFQEAYRANEDHAETPFEQDMIFHNHAKEVQSIVARVLPKIVEHARRDLEA